MISKTAATPHPAHLRDRPNAPSGDASRPLFPVFLDLDRRPCLVVGGGTVGWEKALGLLEAGARVTMVSPRVDAPPRPLPDGHRLRTLERAFQPEDVRGQVLVVAATDRPAVQAEVRRAASEAGVLCNVVDVTALCDFVYGSRLRRGALQVAITTGGRFPILGQRLRDAWAEELPAELAGALEELAHARDRLRARGGSFAENRTRLRELLDARTFEMIRAGRNQELRERIEAWKSSL